MPWPSARGARGRWSAGSLSRPLNRAAGLVFRLFNAGFDCATERLYAGRSAGCCGSALLVLLVYGGLLVPDLLRLHQDARRASSRRRTRAICWSTCSCPTRPRVERTEQVMQRDRGDRPARRPGVKHTVAIAGQSILLNANAPNFGAMYVMLDDFHRPHSTRTCPATRSPPGLQAQLAGRDQRRR